MNSTHLILSTVNIPSYGSVYYKSAVMGF